MSVIKFPQREDVCHFCGAEPDHPGFWACPRLRSVTVDGGSWSVEFWPIIELTEEENDDE